MTKGSGQSSESLKIYQHSGQAPELAPYLFDRSTMLRPLLEFPTGSYVAFNAIIFPRPQFRRTYK
jgi:hypothetical protein